MERFPYLVGNKEKWEVRSLRSKVGDKEALYGNPDFLNQHTDSLSTGLVKIAGPAEEPIVRDLRQWESTTPEFLANVAAGTIHYRFSRKHRTTSRFKAGKNPPIISVVRFLIKAFQFESPISPDERVFTR